MKHTYLRGDIYYADLGHGVGSEQEGCRPVVIIQNNVGNKYSPTVIVASITSKAGEKAKLPTHYYIDTGGDLKLPSIVLLEQLRTVDKRRLGNFIGHLSEKHICGINHALAVSIGLIKNVPQKLTLCLCSTCANNFYNPGITICAGSIHIKQQKAPALTATAGKGWTMRLFVNSEFLIEKIRICTSDIPPFG